MTRNSAEVGGGFYVDRFNTQVVLENSVVSLNRAVENGGGAALYAISMTLRNVSLLGNAVSKGGCGGLYLQYLEEGSVQRCNISLNSAPTSGAGLCVYKSAGVVIEHSEVLGNEARGLTGGLVGSGGGVAIGESRDVLVEYSHFKLNSATQGGAFAMQDSSNIQLSHTTVDDSYAVGDGGSLYVSSCQNLTVQDCSFRSSLAETGFGSSIW
jgi:hypothetical protein